MGLNEQKILGISITTARKEEILEYIRKYLKLSLPCRQAGNYPILKLSNKKKKPLIIVTPNPEQVVYARHDPRFAQILNQADIAIPDGIGLALASRFLKSQFSNPNDQTIPKRIPGVELMQDLVAFAAEKGFSIALIGGRGGVAVRVLECLQDQHPGLKGWAQDGPELNVKDQRSNIKYQISKRKKSKQFNNITIKQSEREVESEYMRRIIDKIRKQGTRLVFVGLGAPKQELFIEELARNLRGTKKSAELTRNSSALLVLMAVGGSFDIISGKTPRAPHAIQAIHLEWLWRLTREPWRWRRQVALLKFFWLVLTRR